MNKRCPNCGACQECGHRPMPQPIYPQWPPMHPWHPPTTVPFYPTTTPFPQTTWIGNSTNAIQ